MNEKAFLLERFEAHRSHLRGVAYRMLGSLTEADDAVQEAWLRFDRADVSDVENLGGWLTTVVARVCLNVLRTRNSHPQDPLDVHMPDPIVSRVDATDPEQSVLLADSIGLALLVVLDTLPPAERLAFVLHDIFAMPFEEIAPVVGRTAEATRQLASRGRRRVQGVPAAPDADPWEQRRVVDAFFAAARNGDFDALVAVLDPDVVARTDGGVHLNLATRGAAQVAAQALRFARPDSLLKPALINGAAGVVVLVDGRPFSIIAFTIVDGRIVEIDSLADQDRLERMDLSDFVA